MYERLRELTEAGLVGRHDASAYVLTSLGRKLNTAIAPLDGWAKVWERQSADLDRSN
jgi:DNA-binding HxlR family transcriptional regulator